MSRLENWEPGIVLWTEFGFSENPKAREQILALTVIRVGEEGPVSFSSNQIAKDLGLAAGSINYHFGSREGLLAEAAILGYKRYTERIWELVETEKKNAQTRLRLWIEESIEIQFEMHGWGPILNFPVTIPEVSEIIKEKHSKEFEKLSELHLARLFWLVEDFKVGKVRNVPLSYGKVPKKKILTDSKMVYLVASLGWSVLGMSVWNAGNHLPSKQIGLQSALIKRMKKYHIDHILSGIKDA